MKLKDFLYEKNGFLYGRDKTGKILKVPKNKFSDGEIVRTAPKHHSPNRFTCLIEPNYSKERGWFYGKSLINLQGDCGGYSFYTNENEFVKLTRADDLLLAKKIYLKKELIEIDKLKLLKESEQEKVLYALEISVPDHDKITHSCKKCFSHFTGFNGGDPNKDLCCDCLTNDNP